jgi:hypothetical protein
LSRIRIAVAPPAGYQAHRPLFDMLSVGLPVDFEQHTANDFSGLQGLVVLSNDEGLLQAASAHGLGVYSVHSADASSVPASAGGIRFTSSTLIHRAFRDRTLADPSLKSFCRVPQNGPVLAECNNKPVWSVERSAAQDIHHSGIALPALCAGEFFHQHFRSARWFAFVPLLHFLRNLLGPERWPVAKPRAVFIIDDPNLHSSSYGFIDFAKLAEHAAAHNYHATIATVPLDTWHFNRGAAEIFRSKRRHISMMIHGVNHVADELARKYSPDDAVALLATGLRRIATFESRSGVHVDRIVAAPHGAFEESIADPMLRLGYESACVSVGSLEHWNPAKPWRADFGLPIAQALGTQALPVFHRTGIMEVDVLLSAFLGHPVIIATHHWDYTSNYALVESLAKMVNDVYAPKWMPIRDISRSNFLAATQQDTLRITPFSRKLTIPLAPGITNVAIEASPFAPQTTIDLSAHAVASGQLRYSLADGALQLNIPPAEFIDYQKVRKARMGLWPIARRILAEGRDRAQPILRFGPARYSS